MRILVSSILFGVVGFLAAKVWFACGRCRQKRQTDSLIEKLIEETKNEFQQRRKNS